MINGSKEQSQLQQMQASFTQREVVSNARIGEQGNLRRHRLTLNSADGFATE